jgi:hypothetical protein
MALNFWSLRWIVGWLFRDGQPKRMGRVKLVLGCGLKGVFFLMVAALLLQGVRFEHDGLSLVVGVSTLPAAILGSLLFQGQGTEVDGASL